MVYSTHKIEDDEDGEDEDRIIHPDLYEMLLASSTLNSPTDVKTARFWETLQFSSGDNYHYFKKWFPTQGVTFPQDDLKFYWYTYTCECSVENQARDCASDSSMVDETLDQYIPIPPEEVPDILALIAKDVEKEKPKHVPVPFHFDPPLDNWNTHKAKDNPERNHRCDLFMGQIVHSAYNVTWSENYYEHCRLIPFDGNYDALVVNESYVPLFNQPDDQVTIPQEEMQRGSVSWKRIVTTFPEAIKNWNRNVPQEVCDQLKEDGLEPMRPLVVESVCVKNAFDHDRHRPIFTHMSVLPLNESE